MVNTNPVFDPAEFLSTEEERAAFLEADSDTDTAGVLLAKLMAVARSRNMAKVARDAGLSRMGLYRAIGEDGDPKLSTLVRVADALGYRFRLEPCVAPDGVKELVVMEVQAPKAAAPYSYKELVRRRDKPSKAAKSKLRKRGKQDGSAEVDALASDVESEKLRQRA